MENTCCANLTVTRSHETHTHTHKRQILAPSKITPDTRVNTRVPSSFPGRSKRRRRRRRLWLTASPQQDIEHTRYDGHDGGRRRRRRKRRRITSRLPRSVQKCRRCRSSRNKAVRGHHRRRRHYHSYSRRSAIRKEIPLAAGRPSRNL